MPIRGLFFGERALQEALNDVGKDVSKLVEKNEVESWQRLTRVLTHEIMNATTPIQSISQAYLSQKAIKNSPYEEGIRAIHETSTELAAFVRSYRKLTQLEQPILSDVNLRDFCESIASLYQDVRWQIDIPETVVLRLDSNLTRLVLINLTKNAIEAGAHRMDIRWNGNLLVSNDGAIIPPEVRTEIFVPFFTTKHTGSGIGLSLSRQIMMLQGMTLSLANIPVSSFHTTFVISRERD